MRYKQEGTKAFAARSLGIYIEEQLRLYHKHHLRVATGWATYLRGVIVYGNTAALLSEKMNFMRDNLLIFWQLKAEQMASDLTLERLWTEGFIRQGYDMQRGLRALAVILRRAEEGDFSILVDESPRTEWLRTMRLRAAIWTALTAVMVWATITLRHEILIGWITWPMVGIVGIAFCGWRLAVSVRQLR